MREKEFEIFIEDLGELINDRINMSINKLAKTNKYKKTYSKYSKLYEQLKKRCSVSEIENFSSIIYAINDLENTYIYLQGFLDGILLREQLK